MTQDDSADFLAQIRNEARAVRFVARSYPGGRHDIIDNKTGVVVGCYPSSSAAIRHALEMNRCPNESNATPVEAKAR